MTTEQFNTADLSTVMYEAVWGVPVDPEQIPQLEPNTCALDIGCGHTDSKVTREFAKVNPETPLIRVDYFDQNVRRHPSGQRLGIVANCLELPFGDNTFGAVITSELTPDNDYFCDEVQRQARLTREISRILKVGGYWLAYNENIKIVDIPPGLVWESGVPYPVKIASYGRSHRLPFGVFRKQAEILDTNMIHDNVGTTASGCATNSYTRALDRFYPVADVLGGNGLPAGEIEGLRLPRIYASYIAPLAVGRCIEQATREAGWRSSVISLGADSTPEAKLLGEINYAERHGIVAVDRPTPKTIIMTPGQALCDQLLAKRLETAACTAAANTN
ncbi:MAG TPA: methyltransferase domain-containing protein [Candidatus Saccharimonadales bacterium]|nr:methyltransferase domain-containing protein [Candidatus Saccharimonadales bacterium]